MADLVVEKHEVAGQHPGERQAGADIRQHAHQLVVVPLGQADAAGEVQTIVAVVQRKSLGRQPGPIGPTQHVQVAEKDAVGGGAHRQPQAGAGADELIDLVLRAVLAPGDVVVNCPPCSSPVMSTGRRLARAP